MLSLRDRLALGIFELNTTVSIPKKSKFLGTITDDGFCDYEVRENDEPYITKSNTRAERMYNSNLARKQRQEIRKLKFGNA